MAPLVFAILSWSQKVNTANAVLTFFMQDWTPELWASVSRP